MHAPIHVVDAPKIDENNDSEVIEMIELLISTSHVPYLMRRNKLVRKVQTHHHTTTCRKKRGGIMQI